MFNKILIANRGEIACRIMRTAKRLGIGTVAVYSDADRDSLHARLADEAVNLGPAEVSNSYLSIAKILAACKSTGAEAVHPGYGFLSEQVAFADALRTEGIVFIGPRPEAIAEMGDKIVSKRTAAAAGVSVVPGYPDSIATIEKAVEIARSIGYPVMIKASAGGGGKGMRIARDDEETRDGFSRAKSEALSAFGDDRVFIEKFISEPRHIEIQVLGDKHGNVVHLGERECSVQRRNQKVLEEAPSPLLDDLTRQNMGQQAVALAKAVGYDSAGTVEFVVGQDKSFYFLEMNTRIQVEHPVTEFVTGLDLIEQMIRVAAGEPLQLRQEDVRFSGWAVEARVYAEDPAQGFLPSTGRLAVFRPPESGRFGDVSVRVDTGVEEGTAITVYYDPMIAKLITHAPTRLAAIEAQATALEAFAIDGVRNNRAFLSSLMTSRRWLDGRLSTSLIAEEYGESVEIRAPQGRLLESVTAVCASVYCRLEQLRYDATDLFPDGQRLVLVFDQEEGDKLEPVVFIARCVEQTISIEFSPVEVLVVSTGWIPPEPTFRGVIGGKPITCQVRCFPSAIVVEHAGTRLKGQVFTPDAARLLSYMPKSNAALGGGIVQSPMPGVVREIAVAIGDEVHTGQAVAVVEAMKMEMTIRASTSGRVAKVFVKPGVTISGNQPLLALEN